MARKLSSKDAEKLRRRLEAKRKEHLMEDRWGRPPNTELREFDEEDDDSGD